MFDTLPRSFTLLTTIAALDPTLQRVRCERDLHAPEYPRQGFVYVISNPAWPGHYKVGRAADYEERLNNYQTSDPMRAYKLRFVWYFRDRNVAERMVHRLLVPWWRGGEWFKCPLHDIIEAIKLVDA